jgi:hypothetical protein
MKKLNLLFAGILFISIISCSKDEHENISTIVYNETTQSNSETTFTSIKLSGKVIATEGTTILSRGICWSINSNPTIENNIVTAENNIFSHTITDLTVNTTYYYRIYAIDTNGVIYSENQSFSTLSLENTVWELTTYYPQTTDFNIISRLDLYENGTTRFDELDLPLQCSGCFITYGTWSLNGNILTYIWEGNDPNTSTYIYTGTISGMNITGSYVHSQLENGIWTASILN